MRLWKLFVSSAVLIFAEDILTDDSLFEQNSDLIDDIDIFSGNFDEISPLFTSADPLSSSFELKSSCFSWDLNLDSDSDSDSSLQILNKVRTRNEAKERLCPDRSQTPASSSPNLNEEKDIRLNDPFTLFNIHLQDGAKKIFLQCRPISYDNENIDECLPAYPYRLCCQLRINEPPMITRMYSFYLVLRECSIGT